MEVKNFDSSVERLVLISLIMDKSVLAQVSSIYQNDMMSCPGANLITSWCVKYFKKYGKAPKNHLRPIFTSWAERSKDKNTIDYIGVVLENLNTEYTQGEEQNSQYMIDLASKHLNKVRIEKTLQLVEGEILSGNVETALEKIQSFKKVEIGQGSTVKLFSDPTALNSVFDEKSESLITYPGALGEFFDDTFQRGSLVSFCAAEKKGKSRWLLEIAFKAVQQRRHTLYLQVGDMSERQIKSRFVIRAARRPWKPQTILYPTSIERMSGQEEAEVSHEDYEFKNYLDRTTAEEAFTKVRTRMKSKVDLFSLCCFPNLAINVLNVKSLVQKIIDDGQLLDFLVVDYMDNLAPVNSKVDYRHQVNETWSMMRAISIEYNLVTVVATQADAKSYNKRTLDMSNFSEAKTKNAHVTAQIGINYTGEEKDKGITRLNYMPRREGEFNSGKCVYVAGCYAINSPAIGKLSTW